MKSNELKELYQEVILDHNSNPRNFGTLEYYTHHTKGHNPLCGDNIELYLEIENDVIKDIKFSGSGCAISKASASVMTTLLKGKNIETAKNLFENFHIAVTSNPSSSYDDLNLGKLNVFCGVREFPARVKCASLSWHTLLNAFDNAVEITKTE